MSELSGGPGWWQAPDGRWHPPNTGPAPSEVADLVDPGRSGFNLGLVSFIVGLVSVFCCLFGFVPGIAAIVLGLKARSEVAKGQESATSAGFGMAGIVLGCIGLVWLPIFALSLFSDPEDDGPLTVIDPVDNEPGPTTTLAAGRPVAIDADATVDGETLVIEGSANLPDGTILVIGVSHAQSDDAELCPSEPLERCTATATTEVDDGEFTADADLAGWPAGEVEVRIALELREGENDDQPEVVVDRYGENGERLRGDQVTEDDGVSVVELVLPVVYAGRPPPEPPPPAVPIVPTTIVATRPPVTEAPIVESPAPPPAASAAGCHPSYSGCVPAGVSDVDCAGGSGDGPAYVDGPITVVGPDVYDLDRDGNGVACES